MKYHLRYFDFRSVDDLSFVFDGLEPNTVYTCVGVLIFDKVESPIPRAVVETLDGVPDKPENLAVLKAEPDKVEIGWTSPTVPRGAVQEFLVDVFPKFDKVSNSLNFFSSSLTFLIVDTFEGPSV
jgi:hypothetical protein